MAQKSPFDIANKELDVLRRYKLSNLDTDGDTQYFGYTDKDGSWYIMQLTSTTALYIKGDSNYQNNWTGRSGLSYGYFYIVFGEE